MKKYFYMVAAVVAALSSCRSENDIFDGGNSNINCETVVLVGTIDTGTSTRTTIADGTGTNKKVYWDSSDEVYISGHRCLAIPDETDPTKATFIVPYSYSSNTSYKAYYPANMVGNEISLPSTYAYSTDKFNMPMYGYGEGVIKFYNICGVLAINVTNEEMSKVTKVVVSSDKFISGPCKIECGTQGYYAVPTTEIGLDYRSVTLDCGTGVIPSSEAEGGTTFYLPIPEIKDAYLDISVLGTLSASKAAEYENFIYRTTVCAHGLNISRNTIYNVNFKTSLSEFLVGGNKKVNFTKGNLYYSTIDSKLHIESEQNVTYLSLGYGKRISEMGNYYYLSFADIDHHCYFDRLNGKTPELMVYGPYGPYSDLVPSGSTPPFCSEANPITVDGTPNLYALTRSEWEALRLCKYVAKKTYLYSKLGVSVTTSAGIFENCFVMAPVSHCNLRIFQAKSSYNEEEWALAEAMGFLCLPAAGMLYSRVGSPYLDYSRYECEEANVNGYYWCSSTNNPEIFTFSSQKSATEPEQAGYGKSVRLVRTVDDDDTGGEIIFGSL